MQQHGGHHAKRKKPVTSRQIFRIPLPSGTKIVKLRSREQNGGCQGEGEGRSGELSFNKYKVLVQQGE